MTPDEQRKHDERVEETSKSIGNLARVIARDFTATTESFEKMAVVMRRLREQQKEIHR